MTATRWPAVIDALVDLMRAQSGFRAPGEESYDRADVLVLDGAEVEITEDDSSAYLVIGGRLAVSDTEDIGEAGQAWGTIAKALQTRDDQGEVVCQAVAQSAGLELPDPDMPTVARDTMRALRARAFSIVDAVDAAIRADVTLGFTGPAAMVAKLSESRMEPRQYHTESGAIVAVSFRVAYRSRI